VVELGRLGSSLDVFDNFSFHGGIRCDERNFEGIEIKFMKSFPKRDGLPEILIKLI